MNIAICILKQNNSYLLQRREFAREKGAIGLIGCFGGKIEPGEQESDAICREINEETSLLTMPADFEYVGRVDVVSDHNLRTVSVSAAIFLLRIPPIQNVVANDGRLLRLPKRDASATLGQMTTATRAAFEQFVLKEG